MIFSLAIQDSALNIVSKNIFVITHMIKMLQKIDSCFRLKLKELYHLK